MWLRKGCANNVQRCSRRTIAVRIRTDLSRAGAGNGSGHVKVQRLYAPPARPVDQGGKAQCALQDEHMREKGRVLACTLSVGASCAAQPSDSCLHTAFRPAPQDPWHSRKTASAAHLLAMTMSWPPCTSNGQVLPPWTALHRHRYLCTAGPKPDAEHQVVICINACTGVQHHITAAHKQYTRPLVHRPDQQPTGMSRRQGACATAQHASTA